MENMGRVIGGSAEGERESATGATAAEPLAKVRGKQGAACRLISDLAYPLSATDHLLAAKPHR